MINAIIIDDEPHCIRQLASMLGEKFKGDIEVLDCFHNLESALNGIHKLHPDLVFLDVRLHDKTGFDLLQSLDSIDFNLIFITAHDKYAIEAFKFSAIDYLLKPINKNDLSRAIGKLKEKLSVENDARKFEALFHNLRNTQAANKRICVSVADKLIVIQVSDIIRCESSRNYTNIYLKDGSKILASKTLKEFEVILEEYDFYRVHNSDLINLAHVKSYNKGSGGSVTMSDNISVEVSFRRKDEFLKKLVKM